MNSTLDIDSTIEALTTTYQMLSKNKDSIADFEIVTRVYNLLVTSLMSGSERKYNSMFDYVSATYPDVFDMFY